MEGMDLTRTNFKGHHATRLSIVHEQVEHSELVEEADLIFDGILIHGLQDHMAGTVGGVAGAAYRTFAIVTRMSSETSLVDAPICCAIEW